MSVEVIEIDSDDELGPTLNPHDAGPDDDSDGIEFIRMGQQYVISPSFC
jgi:hypothetical protein